ncbi:MAG: hypothetical protein CL693_19370 [Cellvibrionaceae bacterium]|nr:hypothetical protein [Cellvibrionaceae bacterium]
MIIEGRAGVCFFNQVGSRLNDAAHEVLSADSVREQEGWFVPLSNDAPTDLPCMTEQLQALPQDEAVSVTQLNAVLAQISSSDQLQVDSTRFQHAYHGWLPIKVVPQGDYSLLQGFEESTGVLTWPLKVSI